MILCLAISVEHRLVTDGWMDRQTDTTTANIRCVYQEKELPDKSQEFIQNLNNTAGIKTYKWNN